MKSSQTISKHDFLKRAESIYKWELTAREKEILVDLAKLYRGSVVLDHWEIFQKRFTGHPAWEFAEWFHYLMDEEIS